MVIINKKNNTNYDTGKVPARIMADHRKYFAHKIGMSYQDNNRVTFEL